MQKKTLLQRFVLIGMVLMTLLVLGYNFKVAQDDLYEVGADDTDFIALATSLAKTGKYGWTNVRGQALLNAYQNDQVQSTDYTFSRYSTWRPPLWPIAMALIFLLTGYSIFHVLLFKFALVILGSYLFYKTLRYFTFSKEWSLVGAWLYLVHPTVQLYSRSFYSEQFTLFIFTVFLFFLVKALTQKTSFFWTAILGGLLILSHPYYLFLPFATFLCLWLFKQISIKQLLGVCFLMALLVSTWILRNAMVLETSAPVLTTSSGAVMAKGWNNQVVALHTNIDGDLADEALVFNQKERILAPTLGELERSQLYSQAAIRYIKENPEQIIPIVGTKLRSAFNPFRESAKPGTLQTGRVLHHLLAFIALLIACCTRADFRIKGMALGLLIGTLAITIVTYSGFRFRVPQLVLELLLIFWVARWLINYFKVRWNGVL